MRDCQSPVCNKRSSNPIDEGWFELDYYRFPRVTDSQKAFCSLDCLEDWIKDYRNARPKKRAKYT